MFDSVGRVTSRSPGRRAGALLLSLLFNGGALGGLTWLGARAVEEVDVVEAFLERPIPPPRSRRPARVPPLRLRRPSSPRRTSSPP
jgi:hypothetical protein